MPVLGLETLQVENMLKNPCRAKAIADAAFTSFVLKTEFRARMRGKCFVPVNPRGTSQFCWRCLSWAPNRQK